MVGKFIDNAWHKAEEIVERYAYVKQFNTLNLYKKVSFLLWTEFNEYWSQRKGKLNVGHHFKDKKDNEITKRIFRKYFGRSVI